MLYTVEDNKSTEWFNKGWSNTSHGMQSFYLKPPAPNPLSVFQVDITQTVKLTFKKDLFQANWVYASLPGHFSHLTTYLVLFLKALAWLPSANSFYAAVWSHLWHTKLNREYILLRSHTNPTKQYQHIPHFQNSLLFPLLQTLQLHLLSTSIICFTVASTVHPNSIPCSFI